jgi:hypothetical protein
LPGFKSVAAFAAEIFICWHAVVTSKLFCYEFSNIIRFFMSFFFVPPAAAKEGFLGTPQIPSEDSVLCTPVLSLPMTKNEFLEISQTPAKDFVLCTPVLSPVAAEGVFGYPEPCQRTQFYGLLLIYYKDDYSYYIAFGFIVVNHFMGVLTLKRFIHSYITQLWSESIP